MRNKILKIIKEKQNFNIIIIALIAVGLIFFASSFSQKEEVKEIEVDHSKYINELEEKIANIASSIIGTTAKASVTLESGTEYIYLNQNTKELEKTEQTYIILKDNNGGEKPLVVTEKMPQIRGVVVIAPGANEQMQEEIQESISALLNIRSSKVKVVN